MEVKDENTPVLQAKVLNGDGDLRRTTPGMPLKPVNDERRLSSQRMKTSSPTKVTPSNSPYTYIRQLDSAERWIERTSVLTKQDHSLNLHHASSILEEIVNSLPISNVSNSWINEEPVGKDETIQQPKQDPQISVSNSFVEIDELASLLSDLALSASFSTNPHAENPVPKKPGSKSVSTFKDSGLMKEVDAIDMSQENLSLSNPAAGCHSKSHSRCTSLAAEKIHSDLNVAKNVEREQLEKQSESKDQVIVNQDNPVVPFNSCYQIPSQSQQADQVKDLVNSVRDASDLQNKSGSVRDANDLQNKSGSVRDAIDLQNKSGSVRDANDLQNESGHFLDTLTPHDEQYVKAGSFQLEEKLDDVQDLHQPNSKLVNSPAAGRLDTSTDELNLNAEPFKPKTQVVNSPIAGKIDDAVCEKDLIVNPFETKTQVVNSPIVGKLDGAVCENDLTVNPFVTKTQVVNSPIAGKLDDAVCEKDLTVNPFETKTQVVNSPITSKLDGAICEKDLTVNPFVTKTQVVNSPITSKLDGAMCVKDLTVNPLETKISLANSPVTKKLESITVEVDPFQPKAQLCNSPTIRELNSAEGIQGLKPDSLQPLAQDKSLSAMDLSDNITDMDISYNITDKLSLNLESFKQNENEQLVNAPTLEQLVNAPASEQLVGEEKELNQSGKPNEANLVILPVTKKCEVSIGEKDPKVTPLKTQTQHIHLTAALQVVKSSDELDLTEDPFIPKAQLFNSPSSSGKLESAEYKQDVSAPEAKLNTPINNPDLNVKSIMPKGQHLNSSPAENTEVSIDDLHLKVDQLKTEAQLNSAGGKFDTECEEMRISLCSPSSQLLSSSSSEQKSHLNYNSNRVQNTLEGSLVGEIQKFSTQDTNTPVKNITQIHEPLENQVVESQLITEMSSSASNKLEVNHVVNPCATQKIQEETVTSSMPSSNCQARNEQIVAKELMKSKDPFPSSSQKVKNCGSIQPDVGNMLEDKNKIVIEDPNVSKNSDDQISTKESILTPNLQTKSPQLPSNTNISVNQLNLKTQLINTPSTNNQTSCNSNNSKSSYDQENNSSIESSSAASFNLTIQEIAMSPEDKDVEQNVLNMEPFMDQCDKAHAQEDMVKKVPDKPFIANDDNIDKESFIKHTALDESIPITPKIKTSSNDDDVTKSKDESIPFSPQEPDIAENEMFIPATEAFNDPAFFDMLEHTSSSQAPNSKRGSVLLKFDPLQDRRDSLASKSLNTSPDTIIQGQAQKPGRMSDVFKDSKLGISFIDESVCLFGTPPRVARRRTLTRRVHNYRAQSIEEENSSNEVDMIFGLDNEGDGMDTFNALSLSLDLENNESLIINDNLHPMNEGPRLVDIGEMPVYTESDLKQIRADLTMHFQELMLKKDREFQEKLKEQGQLAELEKEKFKNETNGLNQKIKSLHGKLKSLNDVMKGYTEIISQLSVEKEKAQHEVEKVTVELSELQKYNGQVIEDNKTLEKSFDDLFHRYEKLKQTLEKAAENEKVLKQAVQNAQEKYKSIKETARKIKEVAEAKIAEQDEKYEKLSSSTKSELTRLEASLKMKDMQVQGLENTLEQKRKENKELTDLCDSLINKVSSK